MNNRFQIEWYLSIWNFLGDLEHAFYIKIVFTSFDRSFVTLIFMVYYTKECKIAFSIKWCTVDVSRVHRVYLNELMFLELDV